MAVLITSEAIVKTVSPKNEKFGIDDLNEIVDGWIEPVKIGPLWIMYKEGSKEEPVNEIASMVFNMHLHGKVLVVPVQQLPTEWDLMEPEDFKYSSEEVDCGFLLSLQHILIQKKLMEESGAFYSPDGTAIFDLVDGKEEWMYDPNLNETDEPTKEFLKSIYEYVVNSKADKLKEGVLFEDEGLIVRVQNIKDLTIAIGQMIDMYVEEEEYEKCAQLQTIINDLKNC
jgi:hypothetical protein